MYQIHFDHRHRTLHVATQGIWTVAIHAKFFLEVFAKGLPARMRYGSIAILGDLREAPIQPAELNSLTEAMISRAVRLNNGPLAFVVGSMLGKLQADRVLGGPTSRIFLDYDDAQDWLRECWIDQGYAVTDQIHRH